MVQNAMVVDDEVGAGEAGARRLAGMAGLLDAGIISEALPAPSHRVQAWDFTTGATPEISDSIFCFSSIFIIILVPIPLFTN